LHRLRGKGWNGFLNHPLLLLAADESHTVNSLSVAGTPTLVREVICSNSPLFFTLRNYE